MVEVGACERDVVAEAFGASVRVFERQARARHAAHSQETAVERVMVHITREGKVVHRVIAPFEDRSQVMDFDEQVIATTGNDATPAKHRSAAVLGNLL